MQWNDSQQASWASVLTHKIQQQWQLNGRSTSFETQKLFCVSCQVLLLVERQQQGTESAGGLFYCYLLYLFISSSSLNEQLSCPGCGFLALRAAQALLSELLLQLSLAPRCCACKGGRSQRDPPVSPPRVWTCCVAAPCYCGDGEELTEIVKAENQPKSCSKAPVFSKKYQAKTVQIVCCNQATNVAAN